jgi:hypothetical protein
MTRAGVAALAVAVLLALGVPAAVADTVELRGGSPAVDGEVAGATAAGVDLAQGSRRVTIP